MAVLLEQSGLFLELCAQPDAPVSVAAALCLNDMVRAPLPSVWRWPELLCIFWEQWKVRPRAWHLLLRTME